MGVLASLKSHSKCVTRKQESLKEFWDIATQASVITGELVTPQLKAIRHTKCQGDDISTPTVTVIRSTFKICRWRNKRAKSLDTSQEWNKKDMLQRIIWFLKNVAPIIQRTMKVIYIEFDPDLESSQFSLQRRKDEGRQFIQLPTAPRKSAPKGCKMAGRKGEMWQKSLPPLPLQGIPLDLGAFHELKAFCLQMGNPTHRVFLRMKGDLQP